MAFPRWPVLEPSFLYGGFPPKALRNKFLFINDVGAYLATLDKAETLTGKCFIPAHAPTVEDIRPLCALNRDKVHEIGALLCEICTKPIFWEIILQKVFDHYELAMDFNQYVLVGSTVRSYLAWLSD